jgi:hypothetical protein
VLCLVRLPPVGLVAGAGFFPKAGVPSGLFSHPPRSPEPRIENFETQTDMDT